MAPSPQPHNRHRSSLEGVINFAQPPLLSPEQRAHAKRKFYSIVNHFLSINHGSEKYNCPLLVRYSYEYALSEESKNIFLQVFFQSMALSIDEDDVDFSDAELEEELGSTFSNFADYLIDNFFLPRKICSHSTSSSATSTSASAASAASATSTSITSTSTTSASAICDTLFKSRQLIHNSTFSQGIYQEDSTALAGLFICYSVRPRRRPALSWHPRSCCSSSRRMSIRDRHRCVISRKFDSAEARSRVQKYGQDARDDDANLLRDNIDFVEVAHILPHSLTEFEPGSSELVCFFSYHLFVGSLHHGTASN
ncbi:hypothetical protein ACQKWADRAFT_131008 [Trichoderma austrokoningii]